jgi:ABC-type dipeptide/oligopeptide/nickel transport system ATPase component
VIDTLLEGLPATATPANDPAHPSPVLRLAGLDVGYRTPDGLVPAVRGASFDLFPGQRAAIVGESGSGKTTLGMAIAGFLRPGTARVTADVLEFDGVAQLPLRAQRQRGPLPRRIPGLSMVFQDAMTSLDPVSTVGSQLVAVLRTQEGIGRAEAREQARSWLARVGLTDTERVLRSRSYELSGGMRQRVMIALALCCRPKLLIADEPTSALDASLAVATMELLVELTDESGAALLMVTHDINLCLRYSHQVFVMNGGEIVERGSPAELRAGARHPYTTGLLQCVPTLDSWDVDELPTMAEAAAGAGGR